MRYLTLDGEDLRQEYGAWFVHKYTFLHSTPARTVNRQESSRRHGSGFSGGKWQTNETGQVTMSITDVDPATGMRGGYPQLSANEEAVKARFLRVDRPILIAELFDDEAWPKTGRQASCEVTREVDHTPTGLTYSELVFRVDVIDAFWRDVNEQVEVAPFSLLRGGSAPIVDAGILIPGTGAPAYRVTDNVTGKWIEWSGSVPSGQWVRLDPLNETGWQVTSESFEGGTEKPGLVRTGAGGFEIHPTVDLTTPTGTKIAARRAFL